MIAIDSSRSFLQNHLPVGTMRAAQAALDASAQTLQVAQVARGIAMQQAETIAALQRIPQIAINQALLEQSTKMTEFVQSLRTSIAASSIVAALETTEALRNIPLAQIQRLLSIWQPSYIPPAFITYGLSADVPPVSEPRRQTKRRKPAHPRTRLIKRLAKQEFFQISAATLVMIQATSPEILDSVKTFSQSPACDKLLALLGPSAGILAEQLSSSDRKALLWIVWILTLLLVFNKQ
ncbi:MAG: hypothetical protein ACFNLO_09220 [Selenomonas massiliensis]